MNAAQPDSNWEPESQAEPRCSGLARARRPPVTRRASHGDAGYGAGCIVTPGPSQAPGQRPSSEGRCRGPSGGPGVSPHCDIPNRHG